jgi:GMP synthase (glutamine-hydrolysing)
MKKLLIIKTGTTYPSIRKTSGDFEKWILDQSEIPKTAAIVYRVYKQLELPEFNEGSAIIITGSHSMVTDQSEWMRCLSVWIREKIFGKIPVLGICFGHQLITTALGGTVDYHSKGEELGSTMIDLTSEGQKDSLFRTLPARFPVYVAHSQTVVRLPPGARLLAGNDFEPHQAFSIGTNVWGVRFHPEFTAAILSQYVHHSKKHLLQEPPSTEESCSPVLEEIYGKRILKRFLEIASQKENAK